jgi:hypothetical protein
MTIGFPGMTSRLGIGAKGTIVTKDKLIMVVESRDGEPGKDVWLCIRRLEDGSFKLAFCNESMEASFEEVRKLALLALVDRATLQGM